MNIEKFWIYCTGLVCFSIVVLVLGICTLHNLRVSKYIENGYTRTTLPGSPYTTWVKEK